jgi:sensor histidine kinase YesM
MMFGLTLLLSLRDWGNSFGLIFIISWAFTFAYWEGNYQIVSYIRVKYPKIEQTTRRILTQVSLSLVYTIATGSLIVLLMHLLGWAPYEMEFHTMTVWLGIFITAIISIIYETVFYFQLWKASLLESERLKKTEARLQFESLKNQVNPHFLFNSLNTLSSLIHVDPDKAEKFVQEFARIYRYVLEVKDKTFVPLEEELGFVRSYVYLQKIRFDDQLIFINKIPKEAEVYYIPPLILQNLVENCIKHNMISEKHPLTVELSLENGVLKVKNKLKERKGHKDATKTGLKNIQQRLRLVCNQEALFYEKEGYYYAEVPLIREEP